MLQRLPHRAVADPHVRGVAAMQHAGGDPKVSERVLLPRDAADRHEHLPARGDADAAADLVPPVHRRDSLPIHAVGDRNDAGGGHTEQLSRLAPDLIADGHDARRSPHEPGVRCPARSVMKPRGRHADPSVDDRGPRADERGERVFRRLAAVCLDDVRRPFGGGVPKAEQSPAGRGQRRGAGILLRLIQHRDGRVEAHLGGGSPEHGDSLRDAGAGERSHEVGREDLRAPPRSRGDDVQHANRTQLKAPPDRLQRRGIRTGRSRPSRGRRGSTP